MDNLLSPFHVSEFGAQITKTEAAFRQLNAAIQMFFEDRDPVAVCTLVAAAGRIFSDLIEHLAPKQSFRSIVVAEMSHVPAREIYFAIDRIPNFLKHADHDPDGIESFNEVENEHRLFIACDECLQLGIEPSIEIDVFQIWYAASNPDKVEREVDPELVSAAERCLPSLNTIDRKTRISIGAAFLSEQRLLSQSDLII